jgi:hypothetical protein
MAGCTIIFSKDNASLAIDATLAQDHGASGEATKHKVETGADISDYINPQPDTLTLSGIIAAYPIRTPLDLLSPPLGALFGQVAEKNTPNRHVEAYDRIKDAIADGELVSVLTGLEIYDDMAILNMASPRRPETGNDFVFTLQLQKMRFATSETVTVPKGAIAAASLPLAQKASHRGRRPKKPARPGLGVP